MRINRAILAALALALAGPALAQSFPGFVGLTAGGRKYIPTPAQWDSYFAGKQDVGGAASALIVTAPGALTAGSLSARAGHSLNVIDDFGADPTGVADSTATLNAAFAASATQPVTVPCGTFKITAPLVVPAHGVVLGQSNYAWYYTTRTATAVPCSLIKIAWAPGWATAAGVLQLGGYTHIEGLAIDAGADNVLPAIYTNQPFDEIFHNFTNGGKYGVYVDYNTGILVQGTRIRNNFLLTAIAGSDGGDGIFLSSSADWDITGNDIAGSQGFAINVNNSGPGIIANNLLQDSQQGGVRLGASANGVIVNSNRFDANYIQDIYFSGLSGKINITGNSFRNGATAGGLLNANFVFNNYATTGCVTISGNSYGSESGATKWIAAVQQGGGVSCADIRDSLGPGASGRFPPTPAAAISTIAWASGVATVTTASAHGMGTSGNVQVTISGASPSGYNGTYNATITGASTFTVPIASNPGTETTPGTYQAQWSAAVLQPFWAPTPSELPGPYANDAAAAAAGVPVGAEYSDTSGVRRKRIS